MNNTAIIVIVYLALINLLTFIYRGVDKWKAVQGGRRVSEKKLLKLIILGGGLGALMGIQVRRHKTLKGAFLWKVYVSIILWIVLFVAFLTQ